MAEKPADKDGNNIPDPFNGSGTVLGPDDSGDYPVGYLINGRYEILSPARHGGMGAVYHCRDHILNMVKALKVIHPHLLKFPQALERFRQEVSISVQLSHDRIVHVYDLDESQGREFLTMEWGGEKSLRELIQERKKQNRPFSLEEADRIISQLCDALQYAHRFTIHRDVKPENILVMQDGNSWSIKLTDFGIAKMLTVSQFNKSSIQRGTPYYIAPEQKQDAGQVDKRADIYSAGVILFELLTLGNTVGPELPSDLNPKLPKEVDDVYRKAVALNPERRYGDAGEFAAALSLLAKAVEEKFWQGTFKQDDEAGYQLYIDAYPHGVYVAEAESRLQEERRKREAAAEAARRQVEEEAIWLGSLKQNNEAGYQLYIAAYPQGVHIAEAKLWLKEEKRKQEAEAFWQDTLEQNDEAGYQSYIDAYPQGVHVAEAKLWLKEEKRKQEAEAFWQDTLKQDGEAGYQSYIDAYPQSVHVAEAKSRLKILQLKEEDAFWERCVKNHSFNAYLILYPQGRYTSEALTEIKKKLEGADKGLATPTVVTVGTGLVVEKTKDKAGMEPRRTGYMMMLFMVILIIGLIVIAISAIHSYQERNRNASAKSDIKNAYTASQMYFSDYPLKEITMDVIRTHGFQPTDSVELILLGKSFDDLLMVARHEKGTVAYVINKDGLITEQDRDAPLPKTVPPGRTGARGESQAAQAVKQEEAEANQLAVAMAEVKAATERAAAFVATLKVDKEGRLKLTPEEKSIFDTPIFPDEAEKAKKEEEAWAKLAPEQKFTNSLGMRFVLIPSGTFMIGSPATEHRVTISKAFYMQTTEVTQGQWKKVMGNNPSYFKNCGEDCPVEDVSWKDVQDFIRKLSIMEGSDKYRLPMDAEWEYAARAGTTTALYNGPIDILGKYNAPALDSIAWYGGNSCVDYAGGYDSSDWKEKQYSCPRSGTHPVGKKRPNGWGLYDMLGNVSEWVQEKTDSGRLVRNGSWFNDASSCRSAYRSNFSPDRGAYSIGFRLARTKQIMAEEQAKKGEAARAKQVSEANAKREEDARIEREADARAKQIEAEEKAKKDTEAGKTGAAGVAAPPWWRF